MPTSRPKNRFREDFQTRNCRWAPFFFFLERHRHADDHQRNLFMHQLLPFVTFWYPKWRSRFQPRKRSRLWVQSPRLDANSTMKVICLHTLSNIYTPENERMTMEKPSMWRCIMMYLLLKMVIVQCYVCFRGRISLRNMVKIPAIQAMFGHDDSSFLLLCSQEDSKKIPGFLPTPGWNDHWGNCKWMTNTFAESSSDGNDFNDMSVL